MVGIGFCDLCKIRIFADEIENKDYFKQNEYFYCKDCMEDIHRCNQCGIARPYCNDCI